MVYFFLVFCCIYGIWYLYKDEILNMPRLKGAKSIFEKRKTELELWVAKSNRSRLDREIFNSSVILKNLSYVRRETPLSADFMYEKLLENSTFLKPIYRQMLTLYRNKKDDEAFKMFSLMIGTRNAKNFAIILSKLEKINLAELNEQMNAFQRSMIESRTTFAIKRVQRNSNIITILATVTVFILLLNFIVVVVFMSTLEMLNGLFI